MKRDDGRSESDCHVPKCLAPVVCRVTWKPTGEPDDLPPLVSYLCAAHLKEMESLGVRPVVNHGKIGSGFGDAAEVDGRIERLMVNKPVDCGCNGHVSRKCGRCVRRVKAREAMEDDDQNLPHAYRTLEEWEPQDP